MPSIVPTALTSDSAEEAKSAAARARIDRLWARGSEFLGCPIAILGGAMSWVSEKHLVSAISNAGGFDDWKKAGLPVRKIDKP